MKIENKLMQEVHEYSRVYYTCHSCLLDFTSMLSSIVTKINDVLLWMHKIDGIKLSNIFYMTSLWIAIRLCS